MLRKDESRKRKRSSSFFEPNKKFKPNPAELQEVIVDTEPLPVTFPLNADYSQIPLLQKINRYLRQHHRAQISEKGYCNGLSIVWLQKMSEGKIDWFYYTRDALIAFPSSRLDEIELDIEKFIAMIEWGQNINNYMTNINIQDISHILETDDVESGLFVGAKENLSQFFRDRRNVMMYMVGANDHVIAIYQSKTMYHVFDANYADGMTKILTNRHALLTEIMNCLFLDFEEPIPDPLKITIARIRNPQALHYSVKQIEDRVEKVEPVQSKQDDSYSFCAIL